MASDIDFRIHVAENPGFPQSPGELTITNIPIGFKETDPLNTQARSGDPGSKEDFLLWRLLPFRAGQWVL